MKELCFTKILLLVAFLLVTSFTAIPNAPISADQVYVDWRAYPMHIAPLAGTIYANGLSPSQIKTAYNLPSSGGAGVTIAIVTAYDTPTVLSDFNFFSKKYNLPDNSTGNFFVYKMAGTVDTNTGWGQETCLDVQWSHAIAPNATIVLVEAKDNSGSSLYSAVDFAASLPGVVAVSMSWGGPETSFEIYRDNHFVKPGVVFFAASGDNKTVVYPAASPNVVAVGGTKLNFYTNGTFQSETGWSLGGGGPSQYENRPDYQTTYGLENLARSVPDVSYNADPSSGVSVYYDGLWYIFGGTSAGAPQWAAIHALGLSATNTNLYQKAKSAYSSYFRDITSGSNDYNATSGYDYVTGLGSPLTINFNTSLNVYPLSGPGNGSITLTGTGFTAQGSVNISYLNPINSTWMSVVNNLPTPTENFTFNLSAPNLLLNNAAGDNSAQFDKIFFRAQDNNNSRAYNSTLPYVEMKRGLTKVGNVTAQGIYGNNTNMVTSLFVQDGDLIPISGRWFSPGSVSLWWDTALIGTVIIDENGFFNTSIRIPQTFAGPHILTINDGATNFCINLTRLPSLLNDYVDRWQTSDFSIKLTPDYAVNETFYRINGGNIQNLTAHGQPLIAFEGDNSTLEYWSLWNIYGTGTTELPHKTLSGIKLDKTAPTGSITTEPFTSTPEIILQLSATDLTSGISQMRFSNDNSSWSDWQPFAASKTWILSGNIGEENVSVQFMDNAGLISTYSCEVTLQIRPPTPPSPTPTPPPTSSPTPTLSPTPNPSPTAIPIPTPISYQTPTPTPNPTPTPRPTILPSTTPTKSPSTSPTPTNTFEPTLSPYQTTNPSIDDSQTNIKSIIPEMQTLILITLALLLLVATFALTRKQIKRKAQTIA